jgi:hypothetical protein
MGLGRTLAAFAGAATATAAIAATAHAGAAPPYFDVGRLPEPPVSGKEMADHTEAFSTR